MKGNQAVLLLGTGLVAGTGVLSFLGATTDEKSKLRIAIRAKTDAARVQLAEWISPDAIEVTKSTTKAKATRKPRAAKKVEPKKLEVVPSPVSKVEADVSDFVEFVETK